LFFPIGFIGAYTTFSTFEYETFKAIEEKNWFIGILNVVGSVVLGFLVVWLGVIMARKM
jgi:CrcB protein